MLTLYNKYTRNVKEKYKMLNITKENFEKEVLGSDIPVVVDFWAPWCGPCRMLAPILEEVETKIGKEAKVCKVNIDDEPELAERFAVMTIPTMIFFKGGVEGEKIVGVRQADDIISMF